MMLRPITRLFNFVSRISKPISDCKPNGPIVGCQLEACSLCQLDCRGCWMRRKNYGLRGSGYLTHENFVKFLNLNPSIRYIELANTGEIFLNPEIVEILKTAFQRGVQLSVNSGTNFNDVSDEQIDAIVRYKINSMAFAIDGASQESYSWYRRGGNFGKVIENIKKLNAKKKELGSELPKLEWQYIIFPSNHSVTEIRKAKSMASELDMSIRFSKDWDGFIPENKTEVESETGLSYKAEKHLTSLKKPVQYCIYLWQSPQINWNGKFFGCCCNLDVGDFGANMFEVSLDEFMKSDMMVKTKKMLLGGKRYKKSPCFNCWFYKDLRKQGKFLDEKDMFEAPW